MAKPATRHRDDMEGHTECGKLLDQAELKVQPSDGSGDPVTCGSCIRQLTKRCYHCREMVVGVRRRVRDSMDNTLEHLPLHCPTCDRYMDYGVRVGARDFKRNRRRDNKAIAANRKEMSARTNQKWRDELAQHKAALAEFDLDMDSCALCGRPVPDRVLESQWNLTLSKEHRFTTGGWRLSAHEVTGFVYCPDCVDMGQALDETLAATFRSVAADVRDGVAARLRPAG